MAAHMARLILRMSINGPSPNNKMAELRKLLESHGVVRIGTAAFEGSFPYEVDAFNAVNDVMSYIANLPPGFKLDHMWTYIDQND